MKYNWSLPTSMFFLISVLIFLLDQITKILIRTQIKEGTSIEIIPNILYFTHATNTGASFSMLTNYSFLLTIIAVLVIIGIFIFYKKIPLQYRIAAALILGGTAGNLIDRLQYGTVTDFINVQIWPIFNVADSAITVAAILLIIIVWKEEKTI
ncbi:signal peptidase II [Candidatus Woesearchaeota archaeon]|nr:signal peptidase II [Candidatus Woesearchaeota archaeon]